MTDMQTRRTDVRVYIPVNVGATVYSYIHPPHYKRGLYEYKVVFVGLNDSKDMGGGFINVKSVKGEFMFPFNFSHIGKIVFLNREDAEMEMLNNDRFQHPSD